MINSWIDKNLCCKIQKGYKKRQLFVEDTCYTINTQVIVVQKRKLTYTELHLCLYLFIQVYFCFLSLLWNQKCILFYYFLVLFSASVKFSMLTKYAQRTTTRGQEHLLQIILGNGYILSQDHNRTNDKKEKILTLKLQIACGKLGKRDSNRFGAWLNKTLFWVFAQ